MKLLSLLLFASILACFNALSLQNDDRLFLGLAQESSDTDRPHYRVTRSRMSYNRGHSFHHGYHPHRHVYLHGHHKVYGTRYMHLHHVGNDHYGYYRNGYWHEYGWAYYHPIAAIVIMLMVFLLCFLIVVVKDKYIN